MANLLFSVTVKDYFKGSGAGGQKRNKTSSVAAGPRLNSYNAETGTFKAWHKLECARLMGEAMWAWNISTEVREGDWVEESQLSRA